MFTVTLTKIDAAQKAKAIREVKAIMPSFNLVEAKKFVESLPKTLKENATKDEAEKLQKAMVAIGAEVSLVSTRSKMLDLSGRRMADTFGLCVRRTERSEDCGGWQCSMFTQNDAPHKRAARPNRDRENNTNDCKSHGLPDGRAPR